MGYTHYWGPFEGTEDKYQDAMNDCQKILENQMHFIEDNSSDGMIYFNGLGDEAHEDFMLPTWSQEIKDFNFCKTARKEYDIVVVACLAVMAEAGLNVHSDGPHLWADGIAMASAILEREIPYPSKLMESPE